LTVPFDHRDMDKDCLFLSTIPTLFREEHLGTEIAPRYFGAFGVEAGALEDGI
jgi:hypothetical protein